MSQLTVRCTVADCNFWGSGNVCDAREILITTEQVAQRYQADVGMQQLATILEEVGETTAGTSRATSCKTFRPKS